MEKVVTDTVAIFEQIPLRNTPDDSGELPEALALMIIDYDGANPSKLVTGKPTPQPGSAAYYENFIIWPSLLAIASSGFRAILPTITNCGDT